MTAQQPSQSDWRCSHCGWMVDTPEHTYGCPVGRGDAFIPTACTCGGIASLNPLRHGFDCPVRTVFQGLPSV